MLGPDNYLYCLLPKDVALATKIQAERDGAGITVMPLRDTYSPQFKRRMTSPDGYLYSVVPIRHTADYGVFWKVLTRAENNRLLLITVAVHGLIRNRAKS